MPLPMMKQVHRIIRHSPAVCRFPGRHRCGGPDTHHPPTQGDTHRIDIAESFTEQDLYWYLGEAALDVKESPHLAEDFSLEANYPKPFNPVTIIAFAPPERSDAMVEIFDMLGRRVAVLVKGELDPGRYGSGGRDGMPGGTPSPVGIRVSVDGGAVRTQPQDGPDAPRHGTHSSAVNPRYSYRYPRPDRRARRSSSSSSGGSS